MYPRSVTTEILNRHSEQAKIAANVGKSVFGYMVGRRRVGKSALLEYMCEKHRGFYHQAIEGTTAGQIENLVSELKLTLPLFSSVAPKSWSEFFTLLSKEKLPPLIVFDEFPYWVSADSTLPSVLQKWIDHDLKNHKTLLMVSGSSQSMLYAQFLSGSAPLYGRSQFFIRLEPMTYNWFCKALRLEVGDPASFEKFALVGGVPHYWKLLDSSSCVNQLEHLFFEPSAILAEEPRLILHDEGITGNVSKTVLDLIGRGVNKPSEIAARVGVPHGHLSRPLAQLVELGLVCRELPFGESLRTSKKVLYSIQDPVLSFYYGTCVPHRQRWGLLSDKEKKELLGLHVSRQFENYCRKVHVGAQRYWEPGLEVDLVAPQKDKSYKAAECKWMQLTPKKETALADELKIKIENSNFKFKKEIFDYRVFSKKDLGALSKLEEQTSKLISSTLRQ